MPQISYLPLTGQILLHMLIYLPEKYVDTRLFLDRKHNAYMQTGIRASNILP